MADYVSVETAPDGDQMAALGRYLYEKELGAPAELVFLDFRGSAAAWR